MTDTPSQDWTAMLERIERIESPRARKALTTIALAASEGCLPHDDLQRLATLAQRLAREEGEGLSDDERRLLDRYRALDERQRQGLLMLLDLPGSIP